MRKASSSICRVARSVVVAIVAVMAAACGGGGGGGGESAGLPVTMTLNATVVSAIAVDVAWTPVATQPTRYELYVNGSYFGPIFTSTQVRLTTLTASTRYCLVVVAVYFPIGATERSNEACVTTMADLPPSAPGGVVATVVSPARVDLAWTAASDDWGVAAYRVHRDGVLLGSAPGLAYSDTSANAAATYCYTVTAVDTGGNASPPSPRVCAATPADIQAPSTPTGLDVTAVDTTVTLSWNASTDDGAVANYRIERDGALAQTLPAPPGTPVQATDPNLGAFTQYCYQVVAVDRAGNRSLPSDRACTTTSWQRSVVFAAPTPFDYIGERNALAVDAAGLLHIGYSVQSWQPATRDYGPAELRHASNPLGAWRQLQIAPSFATAFRPSLAVDRSARAHLAFVDALNGFAQYAQPNGTAQVERIATEAALGVSVAVDGNGVPQVAAGRSAGLRHAVKMAGTWSLADVPGVATSLEPALALDVRGQPNVVFADPTTQTLRYATRATGTWTTATIEPTNSSGWHFAALGIDTNGVAHVSYHDGNARTLKYATNAGGAWVATVVDNAAGSGGRTAIALDAGGVAHISYLDFTRGRLKYATNASGAWRTFELDHAGVGPNGWGDTSIAVGPDGRIHIVYFAGAGLRWVIHP